jgi:hypothetical protein
MQWFKHHNNFRNTPKMQYVQNVLGSAGIAGVYRLYEVFTERFGIDNNFSGSLLLSPPTSEIWLTNEVLPSDDPRERGSGLKELHHFLAVCEQAEIITLEKRESSIENIEEDGSRKITGTKVWTTVTIPGFADLADVYSARKKNSKALETSQ